MSYWKTALAALIGTVLFSALAFGIVALLYTAHIVVLSLMGCMLVGYIGGCLCQLWPSPWEARGRPEKGAPGGYHLPVLPACRWSGEINRAGSTYRLKSGEQKTVAEKRPLTENDA